MFLTYIQLEALRKEEKERKQNSRQTLLLKYSKMSEQVKELDERIKKEEEQLDYLDKLIDQSKTLAEVFGKVSDKEVEDILARRYNKINKARIENSLLRNHLEAKMLDIEYSECDED